MKRCLFVLSTILFSNLCLAETIVEAKKTKEFGLWKIHNEGSYIYIVDTQKGNFYKAFGNAAGGGDYYDVSINENFQYAFHSDTSFFHSAPSGSELSDVSDIAELGIDGHLQDGIFTFKDLEFRVNGEKLLIYNKGSYDNVTAMANRQIELKKYSNSFVYTDSEKNETRLDATVVLNVNDVLGPAKIVGDCNANYNSTTGILSIPCFSIDNDKIVHQINLNQTPKTLDFSADLQTFIRVQ